MFAKHRPQIVFHAAASKHVPLMELNPLAAVENNAIATHGLANLCRQYSVPNLVLISTDKAVNPISIMGASKRVAELALRHAANSATRMAAIRLGNVLSTEGSVVPLFLSQIRNGGPVTVTDPRATRYFFTLEDAVGLILLAAAENSSDIFVPRMNAPVTIREMALELIRESQNENHKAIEVSFIGLRPGDKLSEEFLYAYETSEPTADPRLLRVVSDVGRPSSFEADITALSNRIRARDVVGTIEVVRRLVPEYQPSDVVVRLSQESTV
jgi:FlaA1/EpsC-like NDP-sugar epimerase